MAALLADPAVVVIAPSVLGLLVIAAATVISGLVDTAGAGRPAAIT